MKVFACGVLLCAAIGASAQMTPPPAGAPGPATEVKGAYERVKANILKSADMMPADGYSFKPEPDIRVYGRILTHVIEAQMHTCGALNGVAMDAIGKPPAETAPKAEIVAALKASFDTCDKAFAATTNDNHDAMVSMGKMSRSRIGLLWSTVSHDNEQYAALALYLRLKGIAPPSQEK